MVGYKQIETAIISRMIEYFNQELSESRCVASNLDVLFEAMQLEDADYGCMLDFVDGGNQKYPPFNEPVWLWQIGGVMLVRHRGDTAITDQRVRSIIDRLPLMFQSNRRIGGSALVTVERITPPEEVTIVDIPFYWLAFMITAVDK